MRFDQDRDIREGKRARFARTTSKRRLPPTAWLFAGAGLLAIVLLAFFWPGSTAESAAETDELLVRDFAFLVLRRPLRLLGHL